MRRPDRAIARLLASVALILVGATAAAEPPAGDPELDRIEALERRVNQLETALEDERARRPHPGRLERSDWTQRVRLSGSVSAGYFHRGDASPYDRSDFQLRDARIFLDAELAEDVGPRGAPWVRNVGLTLEWNLIRLGEVANDVGDLYIDFQGIGGRDWANAQVGRFQIPVGEEYLRYGRGRARAPFATDSVGGPWWWDEGIRLYGSREDGRIGYVASVTNGETQFNAGAGGPQGTLKLYARPWPWLYLSASGLVTGTLGAHDSSAMGALWLGEGWARAFGAGSSVQSFSDGVAVPDGPNRIESTWLAGADLVLTPTRYLRAWLAWGRYVIDSAGGRYDRALTYAIAEVVFDGGMLDADLEPLYLGLRTSLLTTGEDDRGYLLDVRYSDVLGYNMQSLLDHSVVVGWRLGPHLRLRGQYSYQQVDAIRGVTPGIAAAADDVQAFVFDVGLDF